MNAIQPAPKTRLRRLVVRLRGSGLINRSVASAALFLVAARLPAQLSAADVIFSAGAGEVDITPDPKMINYYTTHKPLPDPIPLKIQSPISKQL